MTQKILLKRNQTAYASYELAIAALNALTHEPGMPVVATYTESSATKLILVVGKTNGTGAGSYEILASGADVDELTQLLGQHQEKLAGSEAGHAKSSTDITFSDGAGTVNTGKGTSVGDFVTEEIKKVTDIIGSGFTSDSTIATQLEAVKTTADAAQPKDANVSATGDGVYVDVALGGTAANPTLTVTETIQDVATAGEGSKGLAEASDVKAYVDSAAAKGTTTVTQGTGVAVNETVAPDGHKDYKISSNLVLSYNAATESDAATITLKSAVREGEVQAVYGTIQVSDLVGNGVLKDGSYNPETGILTLNFNTADGKGKAVTIDLGALLDIDDMIVGTDSQVYLGVKSVAGTGDKNNFQIDVKVVKLADVTEDTTGLADAKDVKTYVDAKAAAATTTIEEKSSGHVTVSKSTEADGSTKYTVAENDIASAALLGTASDDSSKATAFGKIAKEAEDRAQAITDAINGLDKTAETKGGNVKVTISESDGIVSLDSVEESYATVTKTPSTSSSATPKTDAAISVTAGDEGKLVKASDLNKVAEYAADKVTEEAHRVDKKIADLSAEKSGGSGTVATVKVTTAGGNVSGVEVTTNPANVSASDLSVGSASGAVIGSDLANVKTYIDNAVSGKNVDAEGDDYVGASAADNKVTVAANVQNLVASGTSSADASLSGTAKSLVDGAQAATAIKTYVEAMLSVIDGGTY